MSRIGVPRLPDVASPNYQEALNYRLNALFNEIALQLNNLSEGRLTARHNSATAAPTTGTNAKGDIVWNSNPTELGGVGNMYVIVGFYCIQDGTPGVWREIRTSIE